MTGGFVVCCLLFVVCCLVFVAWCLLLVVCYLLLAICLIFAVYSNNRQAQRAQFNSDVADKSIFKEKRV
jgi:Flp pilus assembly protein TadB